MEKTSASRPSLCKDAPRSKGAREPVNFQEVGGKKKAKLERSNDSHACTFSPPAKESFRQASVVSLSDGSSCSAGPTASAAVIDLTDERLSEASDDAIPISDTCSDTQEANRMEPPVRRSNRQRKSTIVHIDGHAVLAKNNYVLKGDSYQFGAFAVDQEAKARKKMAMKEKTPRKPHKIGPTEVNRIAHNNKVKERVAQKKHERMTFLASNLEVISPFVDSKVKASLQNLVRAYSESETYAKNDLFMQPDLVQAEMRDYQLNGLNWMISMHRMNLAMILGDEMGLGKTLQAISLFCYLKETEKITGPSLVICPLSVIYSWCNELSRWAPSLKFLRFHSSSPEERVSQKEKFISNASKYDVVVTTYEMAKNKDLASLWSRQHFNYVVLDEGHIIKEYTSQISQAVRRLHFGNALVLTGTPLQNNLVELWSILNFLYPDVFTARAPFAEAFDISKKLIDRKTLELAHKLLGLFMLRRLKEEVERLMPKKIETKVICPLSSIQIFWYKALLLKDLDMIIRTSDALEHGSGKSLNHSLLVNLIMQLRKCCNHPFLFQGTEVDIDSTTCQDLIAASGKLAVLDKLLRSLYQKDHRVVLFSQFTSLLDIIEDYCVMRGWKFCRFDGSTPRAKRNFIVNQFNSPDSEYFIFLMSTRSGGMGLNLQTADTCILYDSDWNPQPDIQAMARVHRIGQHKTVHVYRLVSGSTIEERMIQRAEKKLYLDQMVNRGSTSVVAEKVVGLSTGELLSTLSFGCNAVFGDSLAGKNFLPTNKEIEMITDRNRTENFSTGNLRGGVARSTKDFDADSELTSTTHFGGIDFKAIRDAREKEKVKNIPKSLQGIAEEWAANVRKRNRKSRIVMINGNGSGYGSASVPVLTSNNYELEKGECSVFQRELKGSRSCNFGEMKKKRYCSGRDFDEQDFCQVCGDGGELLCCRSCPVCVHQHCVALSRPRDFLLCPHHRCTLCQKNRTDAGGILFACQSCPNTFCDDCLPRGGGVRILGKCDRFEELGFESSHKNCYIHCSKHCEMYAREKFGWSPAPRRRAPVPEEIDVSYAFGGKIDSNADESTNYDISENSCSSLGTFI